MKIFVTGVFFDTQNQFYLVYQNLRFIHQLASALNQKSSKYEV